MIENWGKEVLCKKVVDNVGNRTSASRRSIKFIIDELFVQMREGLLNDYRIEIRNFGILKPYITKARIGRNPHLGTPISIPARRKVKFVASKLLQEKLNTKGE